MNTTTESANESSWWERLTDQSSGEDASKNLFKYLIIAAVVVALGIVAWQFFQSSKQDEIDSRSGLVNDGIKLLPSRGLSTYAQGVGGLPTNSFGANYYTQSTQEYAARGSLAGVLTQPEESAKYLKEVESVLATFSEKESSFEGQDDAWLFWNVRQQLLFFASRNTVDQAKRVKLLEEQIATLQKMQGEFKDHPVLSIPVDASRKDESSMDHWLKLAKQDLEFAKSTRFDSEIAADENLKAVITLENGKELELEFYSRLAPKAVAAFLANALGGFYDGTAAHGVNKDEGFITFGNPLSRLAPERKAIWDNTTGHYTVTNETNPLLPKRTAGAVFLDSKGISSDGFHFKVQLKDAEDLEVANAPVFARVTKGLDGLSEWLETEVHDEAGVTNPNLPRVRLGLKSVRVEGTIQHPSKDSWKPSPKQPEVPDETDAEKGFYEALKTPKTEDESEGESGESEKDG